MIEIIEFINIEFFTNLGADIVIKILCGFAEAICFACKRTVCSVFIGMPCFSIRISIAFGQAVLRSIIIIGADFLNDSAEIVINRSCTLAVFICKKCSARFIIDIGRFFIAVCCRKQITKQIICVYRAGNGCFAVFCFGNSGFNCIAVFIVFISGCFRFAYRFYQQAIVISILRNIKACQALFINIRNISFIIFLQSS
ncbi:hypothetical protein IMSAG250_00330 [Clostridiales bacterium]|nr:hypothetical protein IMSAG250_00330 [Clostridiales bacterium]